MINVFTLTNVTTAITEGKLRKIFISEVCIKLVALRIHWYTRSSLQFRKGWCNIATKIAICLTVHFVVVFLHFGNLCSLTPRFLR